MGIHINQLGYRPDGPKRAVVSQDETSFRIVRVSDETVAYSGTTGEAVYDAASMETVRVADFSMVRERGRYVLCTGTERSYPFVIDDNPCAGLRRALLDMLNYQKCGVDLDCGLWSHPACHNGPARVYGTDEKRDVSGGWHDAGDYGRYIVPAAMTVADLLLARELSPNPDPGLLDAVWFELEWMLKMQDPGTGGVYHKVGCRQFNALDEMPHDERDELILSPVSPTATAGFAATMALASRFYPDNRDLLLDAAGRAWDWCVANPDAPNFTNPPDIRTGQYGDTSDRDERFWAACELFAATGEERYHDAIKSGDIHSGLGWADMGTYGLIAYLSHADGDAALMSTMREKLLRDCREIMGRYGNDPYGVSLGTRYRWGSNLDVGNNAMALLLGSRFADADEGAAFTEAALEHLNYLLGRNPLSRSYVTGFGPTAPERPHHRPSVAVGSAVPGMVVGGPNMTTERDTDLHSRCKGMPPSKCYVDHEGSFSSNEVTIYWNSTVYFVVAVLGL